MIERRLQQTVATLFPDADLVAVLVRPCPDPKFGDYQTNALMALAKARKLNPRQLAGDVLARLDVSEWCEKPEVAGAGFINFRLRPVAIADCLQAAARGEHLFFQPAAAPRTIVVDFSSPNVAKAMHVGHIRSTILGDCLARVLRLLGHRVITDNHLGDWGTQFGKLLVGWKTQLDRVALDRDPVAEMERLYKAINDACESDPAVLERARQELVSLQKGDAENLAIWREMIALSRHEFDATYARLGVRFDHTLGESFYNPFLPATVEELCARGLARESEGALAAFFEDMPELKAHPALIQKSDGGFNYTTTDLATLAYRLATWRPDEIVYVTDGRQQLHFRQLFALFRKWHPEANIKLAHVWFGSILGEDSRPFRTRSGDTIKLTDLLDEAEERALKVVTEKNQDLPEDRRREIARIVGLGAVKYSDLLPNRQSDYVFSWDKMLSLSGNTAPYLQYAYTRIRSIFRKAEQTRGASTSSAAATAAATPSAATLDAGETIGLQHPAEVALARQLLNFGIVLEAVAEDYRPNFLCNYLYELAGHFTTFYENCPVLKAEENDRRTRLALCDLAARVLKQGLNALGIETTEQM
ncbi:MAG: arginine--tRNA ligase [Verrucomicrobia bacterium]|nr:arginine--tRNA ligase [Verrucomicrobiota bacterium]